MCSLAFLVPLPVCFGAATELTARPAIIVSNADSSLRRTE